MVTKQLLAALALAVSFGANAADFSDADAKFALRDQSATGDKITDDKVNLANTQAAKAAYKAIIDQGAKDTDLVRAVDGYVRTFIWEGTHFYGTTTDADRASRKAVFNNCLTAVEGLNPSALGFDSAEYYYFKASCIAYKAEVSTALERLGALLELNKTVDKGLTVTAGDTFEGGGLLRVRAAVLGNPEAKGVPGAYNPKQALVLIDQAIATEEGALFCENFRRKVGIHNELGDKPTALAVADQALVDFPAYLADGLLPESIRAETADCIKTIESQKAGL